VAHVFKILQLVLKLLLLVVSIRFHAFLLAQLLLVIVVDLLVGL